MQRYFISKEQIQDPSVRILGDDVHHMTKVMRNKPGDKFICNTEDGKSALCKIEEINETEVQAVIEAWLDESAELPVEVTIAQGIPKGDKFEWILQKGTELGAAKFIPFAAERSVAKWDDQKFHKKAKRFEKITKEASEQSHRNRIPELSPVMQFKDLLEESESYTVKLFAYEEEAKGAEKKSSLFASVLDNISENDRILLVIGPEGGISTEEVNHLKESGFQAIRLGKRILRTETAALYALASISYHVEELRYKL
ncbi:16S rRNA (uracil(1498)-N(3))-methyltransferase [Oceanobacillus neutriphilus]|uniref:Ribosomal RNA small subunit methyltransferase E n=1 Tax=Oceanobacillus neutriphilus TaxID=531815 RepID=A0ABQ2NX26_9BACI|nr:16S rRNA (uracil(1498)-N(3))-methyltransferase [Oceanobacillus neutriphilus]GGP12592.1 ribosomal RNA small subunit methyltransferase E [Oceanobacillus neutriphilus]